MMTIDELLIDFDEMGFVPTTLCENPDEYARDWKKQLLVEIKRLKAELKQLQTNAEILARGVRDFNHENYELTEKIKHVKIDVLNKVKERAVGLAAIETYHICNLVDELLKEYE